MCYYITYYIYIYTYEEGSPQPPFYRSCAILDPAPPAKNALLGAVRREQPDIEAMGEFIQNEDLTNDKWIYNW